MSSLQLFIWLGTNRSKPRITGHLLAYSAIQLKRILDRKGIELRKFIAKPVPFIAAYQHEVNYSDTTTFTYQLALILEAGLPIGLALYELQHSSERQGVRALLEELHYQIQQGQKLSIAMQEFTFLDPIYLQFVRIGEENGDLSTALGFCTQHREKNQQLIKQVTSALIYPTSVIIMACVVFAIMMTFVIPQFSSLFHSFGAELPKLTKLIVELSSWFQNYVWGLLFYLIIFTSLVYLCYRKNKPFRYHIAKYSLSIPILGRCILVSELARFNLLLCNGIQAGLPLVTCLNNASLAVRNAFIREALSNANISIKEGKSLYHSLEGLSFLPSIMLKMVKIGELSGTLAVITGRLATLFEQQLKETTDKLGQLIEPFIIVFLGTLVGGLVISMYLPIFSLMSAVG
ncbi:type II secretion system protein F [Vibrio inusitatus NBRC 102082]|uniref:Type II secretion system protein F n=1 Tax=Vibrio inusitatus NBRC 102082 TaxID=1219070 RepID=A0A4Y3I042_9VIBR|nr:type II secretion system F family protein [Vibrio inusitatus]GEA52803.1 type II secretion system protein F [Vibrio inusitatus NBRC 102082]